MIAVDSSVLIDLIGDGAGAEAAAHSLRDALHHGPVVVCDVALAEICTALKQGSDVLGYLEGAGLRYSAVESKAALRAGEMQRRYRQRGGEGQRAVPDFLVGAHALLQCDGLITRDADFFRDYFKGLKVIEPRAA
ncbi:MAG TPA: type II toxin-antitoxin system VapC family toxin [Methylibium sp.]|uniref:type II toxin-antitoxin system VapC family toxin n=1 Tax=Methylibium sp. TaxID=2067992 RepID=UPI002DC005BE|nr:type II toxin-antitoxin system VapC family toxin [Methylibium sp.]HEU4457824.1 type II toxin-antitoxin system VapC family toxin [Methylibium sp.]